MRAILFGVLGVASIVSAGLVPSGDPSDPSIPMPRPTRKLQWGDVNVLHTTDIHGWVSGHSKDVYPEKSWSGDFGDFASFVQHMRKIAEEQNSDLLLVDTGDSRSGHGLTDHIKKGGLKGSEVPLLYWKIGYDLVVPGNHDFDNADTVKWIKDKMAHIWGKRYLTSNVDRTDKRDRSGNNEPLGVRYRYWQTRTNKHIMALGVVTAETDEKKLRESNLKVIPIHEMIEQQWFKDVTKPNPETPVDVFVVLGHVNPQSADSKDNIELVYQAIRQNHPLTPILIFAGHSHQRWCRTFPGQDGSIRSMLLQSGQYFETVGWMSVKLDNNATPKDLEFSRRYLDNNDLTYRHHLGLGDKDPFKTTLGASITKEIQSLTRTAQLSEVYGWLDSDYYLDRKVWSADDKDDESLFKFYLNAVEHSLIDQQKSPNWLFFSNWGMIRSDLYRGKVTMGDLYAISPDGDDESPFLHARVSRSVADHIIEKVQILEQATKSLPATAQGPSSVTQNAITDNSQTRFSLLYPRSELLTYGRKTKDLCGYDGNDGDDVRHEEIPRVDFDHTESGLPVYFWRRNYRSLNLNPNSEVDVIVPNYIGDKYVKAALEELRVNVELQPYRTDVNQKTLLEIYIKDKFPFKSSPPDNNSA